MKNINKKIILTYHLLFSYLPFCQKGGNAQEGGGGSRTTAAPLPVNAVSCNLLGGYIRHD